MNEYIEREAALFAALMGADEWDGCSNYERDVVIEKAMNRVPTADVALVRHGEWGALKVTRDIGIPHEFELPCCSICGCVQNDFTNYCPNCGARMDGKGEGK